MRFFPVFAVLALTHNSMALAADGQVTVAPTTADAPVTAIASTPVASKRPKLICQDSETLGTRLGKRRICATAEEWAARRDNDQYMTQRIQSFHCVVGAFGQTC